MNDALKLCYWIQGFAEIHKSKPTKAQWKEICNRVMACEVDDGDGDGLMKPEAFVTWLKGFVELANPDSIDTTRWNVIKEHLQMVFIKLTSEDDENPNNIQDILDKLKEVDKKEPWQPNDPWKKPYDPYDPLRPMFDPNRKICSNGDKTYCSSMKVTPSPKIDTSIVACAVYQLDPVKDDG